MKHGKDPVDREIICPYRDGKLIPESDFKSSCPRAYRYLRRHRSRLLERDKGEFNPEKWHGHGREVSIVSGFGEKILASALNLLPNFQYCPDANALFHSGCCIKPHRNVDATRLIDELNSERMRQYIEIMSKPYRNGWYSHAKTFIMDFPVPDTVFE